MQSVVQRGGDDVDDAALLRRLQRFCAQKAALCLGEGEGGEIRMRAKFDHAGFVAGTRLNLQMDLFSDARCKHALGIGHHALLFVNGRAVRLPTKYGFEKKRKAGAGAVAQQSEEGAGAGEGEDAMLSAVERVSRHDAWELFGVDVVRYEKGKAEHRYDFLCLVGDLKHDIHDVSLFVFGCAGDDHSASAFVVHKRVGPDALPVAPKLKRAANRLEHLSDHSLMSDLLGRIEFKLEQHTDLLVPPRKLAFEADIK